MCPHCGRDAPLLYRGPLAYCSACNKPRVPLSAAGVNLTGKPAKLGGTVASVLGWVVLAVMLAIALILGAVLQAVFPPGAIVGWAVGGVVAAIGIGAALLLLLGGRFLHRTGDKASTQARKDAVFALAQNNRGILRADVVAGATGLSVAEADAFLTDLSRQQDSGVVLEFDNDGKLYYRFPAIASQAPWPDLAPLPATAASPGATQVEAPRMRVASPAARTQLGEPLVPDDAVDDSEEETSAGTKRARTIL